MRYFEIVEPPARHILADADPKETAPGQHAMAGYETAGRRAMHLSNLLNPINRPSRRPHLSPQRSQ